MCGIAGIYNFKRNGFDNNSYLRWCLQTMKHRGPDSNGIWENEYYHTAFARLSIRDLSHNGDQPMHSADGRYVISFNGEIYNSDEFKTILQRDGVHFSSTSDTEVLLYSLIKWNPAFILPKLNGMFAFAFYDKLKNELIVARDRVGIKPLYIGRSNNGIVFSSQYDHIINHPFCSNNSFHEESLGLYLQLGFVPDNAGVIKETFMLPHGFFAVINQDIKYSEHAYYDYPSQANDFPLSLEEALDQSIQQQLVSDVPIGTFMSGGVDSTLVTSIAAAKIPHVKSFTIGIDDARFDESTAAESFAGYFNTEHFQKQITYSDMLLWLNKNFLAYSEPFADYSSIPTLILSDFAKSKVTVALSGDGGDELFWGYPKQANILNTLSVYKQSKPIRQLLFIKEKLLSTSSRKVKKRHLTSPDYLDYYYHSLFITGANQWQPKLFKGNTSDAFFFKQQAASLSDLNDTVLMMNKIRKLEVDIHLQRMLIKVDRASMYSSLESRVPLLDNALLDYSTSVNYEACIKNGSGKHNLKVLLAAKTNEQLVYQPKKGFGVPLDKWMQQEMYHEVREKLMEMPAHLSGYFDKKVLDQMLTIHKSGRDNLSWILWAVYALVKWDAIHRKKIRS